MSIKKLKNIVEINNLIYIEYILKTRLRQSNIYYNTSRNQRLKAIRDKRLNKILYQL